VPTSKGEGREGMGKGKEGDGKGREEGKGEGGPPSRIGKLQRWQPLVLRYGRLQSMDCDWWCACAAMQLAVISFNKTTYCQ